MCLLYWYTIEVLYSLEPMNRFCPFDVKNFWKGRIGNFLIIYELMFFFWNFESSRSFLFLEYATIRSTMCLFLPPVTRWTVIIKESYFSSAYIFVYHSLQFLTCAHKLNHRMVASDSLSFSKVVDGQNSMRILKYVRHNPADCCIFGRFSRVLSPVIYSAIYRFDSRV